eukprot:CAMPEP_0119360254 /NCGR_PEP_ID=MMETSP1334-20130426/7920_1 /TAXON_ID=127549 /ORGANISM="Calcidiscus leptoporus, Strain RCC1130" /LENGTH=31 /DNA_ID= /DNA_START= /DNA_END= /DNA_ORIENTATION=
MIDAKITHKTNHGKTWALTESDELILSPATN